MRKIRLIISVILYAIILCGCRSESVDVVQIVVNNNVLLVEVADSEEERALGLMYRDKLREDRGMLFVFEEEAYRAFWMKNTKIPLSLAYINEQGVITEIVDMAPFDERSHKSTKKAKYALEVNQGWFENHNIKVGDSIGFTFLNK
ncbi:MAG: DUF192 domain-containing protein [Candidatus Auribacter fodinae]|uniref:DUF192 domain-containing protein n=1 Tax=Candidatus Auribacter fodinae TaxID=2093366 RepID=A0A3A4QYT4_9BACT|nr:MAG: DUF192 domain-containing protein [Candidatus Auribacter fodinae]